MRRAAMLVAGLLASQATLADEGPALYLHVIPTDSAAGVSLANGLVVDLVSTAPQRLAEQLTAHGLRVMFVSDDRVAVALSGQAIVGGDPQTRLASTFVVDHAEPALGPLVGLYKAHERESIAERLLHTVDEWITEKRAGDFKLASAVAHERAGDCTEHAVLAAALARATGTPAQVVLGLLLLDEGGTVGAFGHAWTEIYNDGHWQVVDATNPQARVSPAQIRYLPLARLEAEGPDYTWALMKILAAFPGRVENIRALER